MRGSGKKSRYSLAAPAHKDKAAPAEIELLHTRALLALRNFTHYGGGEKAVALLDQLLRDYKIYQRDEEHKYDVWRRFAEARARIISADRSEAMKERVRLAIREVNRLAKKYGYEKPPKNS